MERLLYSKEDILKVQEEAVEMEEAAQTEGKPKTDKLAKLYKVKAALLEFIGRKEEAKAFFKRAADILRENGKEEEAKFIEMHSEKMDEPQQEFYPQQAQALDQQAQA